MPETGNQLGNQQHGYFKKSALRGGPVKGPVRGERDHWANGQAISRNRQWTGPSALSALFRIEKREEAECGWRKPPQEKIQKMHLPAIYVIFSPRISNK